jgi:transcription antitermination factor NusG
VPEPAGHPAWYAIQVNARKEQASQKDLTRRGFEVFLPTRVDRRMWSDRIRKVQVALFPGYLFVRTVMEPGERHRILAGSGVFDLVGRIPGDSLDVQAVPDREIASLQRLVAAERELDPIEKLVEGTQVEIGAGPLKGTWGVVEKAPDGRRRLVVQVHLLGRGVRTDLSADDVVAARDPERLRVLEKGVER